MQRLRTRVPAVGGNSNVMFIALRKQGLRKKAARAVAEAHAARRGARKPTTTSRATRRDATRGRSPRRRWPRISGCDVSRQLRRRPHTEASAVVTARCGAARAAAHNDRLKP